MRANIAMILIICLVIMIIDVYSMPVRWTPPLVNKAKRRHLLPEELMDLGGEINGSFSNVSNVCSFGVHLEWATRVGGSVFATPRIVDLTHDGSKEILVATYTHYFEAVDGANGEDIVGFPFAHPRFKSYASPLPVDMDGDGKTQWLIAMYTGELMVFLDDGKVRGAVQLPSLPVKKDWVKKNLSGGDAVSFKTKETQPSEEYLERILHAKEILDMTRRFEPNLKNNYDTAEKRSAAASTRGDAGPHRRVATLNTENDEDGFFFEELYDDDNDLLLSELEGQGIGTEGYLSDEARESMDLLYHPELFKSSVNYEDEKDAFNSLNIRNPTVVICSDDEVEVDPHVMSTPVIVDVDGDGDLDIVLHVSYFFDPKVYEENDKLLPPDINVDDYVVDVLMVLDLVTGKVKWIKVLHLTQKNYTTPAYALSSPVVACTKNSKFCNIYVTTTACAIFGFTGEGKLIDGWPVWMNNTITASASLEDVDSDGILDICAGDAGGNVACYTTKGTVIWSKSFLGAITEHITFGDIDGDGKIDLAFGTANGHVYAVRGHSGVLLPKFPIITEGPIFASLLLVNLNNTQPSVREGTNGLHVVVPSHDGVLYLVSGTTGCVEAIDIGEKSSTMVLADDVTGSGNLELVVSTLSGSIMVFGTQAAFHPLKAWTSRVKSLNGFTASEGNVGVFIHPSSRVSRDIRGERFVLLVTIYDERKNTAAEKQYGLIITIGPRILVHHKVYYAPGTYSITLSTPLERMYASVLVSMVLPNGQKFEDSLALSFNMHFLESIKLAFLLPFLVGCLAISFVSKRHEVQPPSDEMQFFQL